MVATARRLTDEGFHPMPHLAARTVPDAATLEAWLRRYRDEAGVGQALLLGGGIAEPVGAFDSSIAMLETGLFDRLGFRRQIGRASCRERVCQYVSISVVAVSLKKTNIKTQIE